MKLLIHLLGVMVAAGLGLGIGSVWRAQTERHLDSPGLRAEMATNSDGSSAQQFLTARKRMAPRPHDDSPLATQLARDLSVSSRVARWLYWLEAIENASLPDLPRLAALANGDAIATRLVASRWVQLDLRHMYDTLAAANWSAGLRSRVDEAAENSRDWNPALRRTLPVDELAEVLFLEWARRDPDAAVTALQGTNHLGTRELWRFNVAGYLVEKDPERGLRALSEWGIDRASLSWKRRSYFLAIRSRQ
jgi:hypothetical protein